MHFYALQHYFAAILYSSKVFLKWFGKPSYEHGSNISEISLKQKNDLKKWLCHICAKSEVNLTQT